MTTMVAERVMDKNFPVRVVAFGTQGKGSVVCLNMEELTKALKEVIVDEKLGRAGRVLVIEQFEKPPATIEWDRNKNDDTSQEQSR